MRVVISGSSGMVGSALADRLMRRGHHVMRLVRDGSVNRPAVGPMGTRIAWDPAAGRIDAASLEGVDAVIHLAGEPIAQRWNDRIKQRIRDSRVQSTTLLSEALAGLRCKPGVLISASAVGYYGDGGDQELDETAPSGEGFLAEVARQWEAATAPARQAGVRTVCLRLGVVLGRTGGALAKMAPVFRLGLGGRLGDGRQYMSWIALADVLGAIEQVLADGRASGPVNLCSPQPVTNRAFTRALGVALGRPTILPVPAIALRLLFGEMADQTLLASCRCVPGRLADLGYRFTHETLAEALTAIFGQ